MYCNIGFDLSLSGRWETRFAPALAEATLYFLFLGSRQDFILLDCLPEPAYFEYLERYGFALPATLPDNSVLTACTPFPWGWDHDASERFMKSGLHEGFPDLEVVRRANSREFSHNLGLETGLGVPGSQLFTSMSELVLFLARSEPRSRVIKPFHGNAGNGFIHLVNNRLSPTEQKQLELLFSHEGHGVVVEPWLEKIGDISCRFFLDPSGTFSEWNYHQTLNNSAGIFYGIYLEPDRSWIQPWSDQLQDMSTIVADRLHQLGYSGMIGIDALIYRHEQNQVRLLPLLEINARQTMSSIAYVLYRKLAPRKHCLFLFAPAKKLRHLNNYAEFQRVFSGIHYNPSSQTGVFLFTPIHYTYCGQRHSPRRTGFFIAANTKEEMLHLDGEIRKRIQKKPQSCSYERFLQ